MEFRRLLTSDLPDVLALQERNLFENLSDGERADGFLSARFSAEQFRTMDRDVAVIVARDADQLAGYLCSSGVTFNSRFGLLAAMIERFPHITFGGAPLATQRVCIYGPVCIERSLRGKGVLTGLYRGLLNIAQGRFDSGVAFIAQSNPRSLAAHVGRLGMERVGDFSFNDKSYWIVAFAIENLVG